MNRVVEWLESVEGEIWAQGHFSLEASDCHDMIEIVDDYTDEVMDDHTARSSSMRMKRLIKDEPVWADLTWTPDQDPTRV